MSISVLVIGIRTNYRHLNCLFEVFRGCLVSRIQEIIQFDDGHEDRGGCLYTCSHTPDAPIPPNFTSVLWTVLIRSRICPQQVMWAFKIRFVYSK